jgi:hypothetical protein
LAGPRVHRDGHVVARDWRGCEHRDFQRGERPPAGPLPYANPDRLVILWNRSPGLGISEDWFSTAQYFRILSERLATLPGVTAAGSVSALPLSQMMSWGGARRKHSDS